MELKSISAILVVECAQCGEKVARPHDYPTYQSLTNKKGSDAEETKQVWGAAMVAAVEYMVKSVLHKGWRYANTGEDAKELCCKECADRCEG